MLKTISVRYIKRTNDKTDVTRRQQLRDLRYELTITKNDKFWSNKSDKKQIIAKYVCSSLKSRTHFVQWTDYQRQKKGAF